MSADTDDSEIFDDIIGSIGSRSLKKNSFKIVKLTLPVLALDPPFTLGGCGQ
jgi:hypothetical protein